MTLKSLVLVLSSAYFERHSRSQSLHIRDVVVWEIYGVVAELNISIYFFCITSEPI